MIGKDKLPSGEIINLRTEGEVLTPDTHIAAAQKEAEQMIQASVVSAKRFPRDQDQAYEKIMRTCKRPSFAKQALYSYPRGGKTISGESVNLAREMAREWGNIIYGIEIVRDTPESRQIRGIAWDMETNTRVTLEDSFEKLIQRKSPGGNTIWVTPDERDLRELTFRRGAILERNCLLRILPKDFREDAMAQVQKTLANKAAEDPDAERKKIITAFSAINVGPDILKELLGHELETASPEEMVMLRSIYKGISDGDATIQEFLGHVRGEVAGDEDDTPVRTLKDIVNKKKKEKE